MSEQEHQETNGTSNGDVPEIELIIKVGIIKYICCIYKEICTVNFSVCAPKLGA